MDAYDRELRLRESALRSKLKRQWKRTVRRWVIYAKVGTLPASWLKISPGVWSTRPDNNPDVGESFLARECDPGGNIHAGAKHQRYRICEIKRMPRQTLYYLEMM